jgi:hypothetical protein
VRDVLWRKYKSLQQMLEPWKKEASAGRAFPRHQSQTYAVATLLAGLQERIEADLALPENPPRPARPLNTSTIENRILTAYQIWNVFRLKFAQRLEPHLEKFLRAADELAWLCYLPAQTTAYGKSDPRCKEPPLVYFSAEASPMIDPRDGRFQPDGVPAQLVAAYGWPEAATRLPFALIGLPWYQTGFLPGALAIAHEIGHAVEEDFRLGDQLMELLATTVATIGIRTVVWKRWQHEMFADLWGVLCLGPSYGLMLSDFLWPRHQESPSVNLTGQYPPAVLRVHWTCCVIRTIADRAFVAQADELWVHWHQLDEFGFDAAFLDDAVAICGAWLGAEYAGLGNRQLERVITFTRAQDADAHEEATKARAQPPVASTHRDVRVLWAAVQRAFDSAATDILLGRIRAAASNKPRKLAPREQVDRENYLKTSGTNLI